MEQTKIDPSDNLIFSTQIIKKTLQNRIHNELNKTMDKKCLYAHKQILNTINFIYDFKFSMIGNIYQFAQDPNAIDEDPADILFFFIYAKPSALKTIKSIIVQNEASFKKKIYNIYFFPAKDYLCEEQLKKLGIYDKVKIKKIDFNFIPFTSKLLSLELPFNLTTNQRQSSIIQSLLKLEYMRGSFKNIYGKGKAAKSILQFLDFRRKQIPQIMQKQNDEDILIVLDRKIDLITPLLTGLSYQCLLDFFFGIDLNRIDVPVQIISSELSSFDKINNDNDKEKQFQTFLLYNKKDPIYSEICHMNINDIPTFLKQKSQQFKNKMESINEIRQQQGVGNTEQINKLRAEYAIFQKHQAMVLYILNKMKSVQFNNSLLIQSAIIQGNDSENKFKYQDIQFLSLFYEIQHLLRLVCLHSQVSNTSRYYIKNEKQIVQMILNCDRIDSLPSLYNLVKDEILRQSKFKNNWNQIQQKFNLFPEESDSYTNINIIYSALSVKVIQLILKNKLDPQRSSLVAKDSYYKGSIPRYYNNSNNIFVFFIGGISYNEINCIKAMEKSEKKNIIVLTTQILGINDLIKNNLFRPID